MTSIGTKGRIRRLLFVAAALLAGVCALAPVGLPEAKAQLLADPLAKVEAEVDRDYPSVRHLSAAQLAALRAAKKPLLLLDVREAGEYRVGRIPAATQVDPGVWSYMFVREFGPRVKGRTVVFYCSVGVRSSKLARRVQQQLMAAGASAVYNLKGGVFRWHNDGRPLVDAAGATPYVHPYDKYWGRLLNRQNFARYKPGGG